MSEREELEADTLNMTQGEQSDWMGTDPYRWAHACIQHAKAAGPEFGEDADESTLDFVATWFASAMMAKSDAISRLPKGNGELVEAVRAEQSENLRRDVGYAVAQYRNLIRLHTKGEPILLRIVEERLSGNHDAADKLFDLLNIEEDNSHE